MKKLLIVCGLLFSIVTLAQAQSGGRKKMESPEARAKMSAEKLAKKLDLNKDQRTRMEDIYLEESTAMAKEWKDNTSDKEAKKASMMKIHDETDAKITAELTDAQKQKYETWKAEKPKHMKKEKSQR
nr:hypothetical protein [Pedobacter panaciterrae]